MFPAYISTNYNDLTKNNKNLDDLSTQAGRAREKSSNYIGSQIYPYKQFIDTPIGDSFYALLNNLPLAEVFIDTTNVGSIKDRYQNLLTLYALNSGLVPDHDGNYSE